MDKKESLNSSKRGKDFALLVGVMVACAHFVITISMLLIMEKTYSIVHYLSEFITWVLLAPTGVPIIMISDLLQIDSPALFDFSPFSLLVFACSSAFYGITGGFLASNQKSLKRVGIAFISLLILSSCLVLVLIY